MRKKRDTRPSSAIPRLLRNAFEFAEQGDEIKAREFWATAVERGYQVVPKTQKWFETVLSRGILDRGLRRSSPSQPPPESNHP